MQALDTLNKKLDTLLRKFAALESENKRLKETIAKQIKTEEKLNKKLNVPFFNEQVTLIRSGLYKAQGNPTAGKAMLGQLIAQLEEEDNNSLLGKAYFEMSEYYSGIFLQDTMIVRIRYLKLAIAAFRQTKNHH